jgi:hypothetical protein
MMKNLFSVMRKCDRKDVKRQGLCRLKATGTWTSTFDSLLVIPHGNLEGSLPDAVRPFVADCFKGAAIDTVAAAHRTSCGVFN